MRKVRSIAASFITYPIVCRLQQAVSSCLLLTVFITAAILYAYFLKKAKLSSKPGGVHVVLYDTSLVSPIPDIMIVGL